jgi:SulP family sulfate permease
MIGQSMINVNSGARQRVSSTVAGLTLLLIVLVAYPLINQIPVSALVGVMFDVCYHTLEWRSLTLMLLAALPASLREGLFSERISKQRIRRADALIILLVTVVTLFTNLAEGVAVGMLLAFLMFAYESSELISVVTKEVDGVKFYHVHGILFFGSTTQFLELFDEVNDPVEVRIVFESGYVADFSAIEALNKLGERYGMQTPKKTVTLQELKPRTTQILSQAATLLREEITLQFTQEEIIPAERDHFNVESYGTGMSRQVSWASRRETEDTDESSDHAQVGV